MDKSDFRCVQQQAPGLRINRSEAIQGVAHDGVANRQHMNPQLVRSARDRLQFHACVLRIGTG